MPDLKQVIDADVASCPTLDGASLSRLEYWLQALGHQGVATITHDFHTGLRVGNLTALRWRDVDPKAC